MSALLAVLDQYGFAIRPWAASVGARMLAEVDRRDLRAWKSLSREIGLGIRAEIATAPSGVLLRELQAEQVELITSLPKKAGLRVQTLTTEALSSGRRAEDIAQEILATGRVTESRARLIARTEVAKASSNFVQARAVAAGSEGYIWRTSDDSDVRETHRAQEGRYIRWSSPPKTDPNLDPYHAGCGPNCRCYPEPVFPEL